MFTHRTHSNFKTNGFTLIELLVVVAIIGVLSGVVLASLSGARESARDARRESDLDSIRTALELYRNDNNGQWPLESNNQDVPEEDDQAAGIIAVDQGNQISSILSEYMQAVPTDPSHPDKYYYFDANTRCDGASNLVTLTIFQGFETQESIDLKTRAIGPENYGCTNIDNGDLNARSHTIVLDQH